MASIENQTDKTECKESVPQITISFDQLDINRYTTNSYPDPHPDLQPDPGAGNPNFDEDSKDNLPQVQGSESKSAPVTKARKTRRPDVAIYRPGRHSLNKTPEANAGNEGTQPDDQRSLNDTSRASGDHLDETTTPSEKPKSRKKRAEQPKYVPKRLMQSNAKQVAVDDRRPNVDPENNVATAGKNQQRNVDISDKSPASTSTVQATPELSGEQTNRDKAVESSSASSSGDAGHSRVNERAHHTQRKGNAATGDILHQSEVSNHPNSVLRGASPAAEKSGVSSGPESNNRGSVRVTISNNDSQRIVEKGRHNSNDKGSTRKADNTGNTDKSRESHPTNNTRRGQTQVKQGRSPTDNSISPLNREERQANRSKDESFASRANSGKARTKRQDGRRNHNDIEPQNSQANNVKHDRSGSDYREGLETETGESKSRKKSVSFSEKDVEESAEVSASDLQESIEALSAAVSSRSTPRSPGSEEVKQSTGRVGDRRPTSHKATSHKGGGKADDRSHGRTGNGAEYRSQNKTTKGTEERTHGRSGKGKGDSRLYDPYSNAAQHKEPSRSVGGLLRVNPSSSERERRSSGNEDSRVLYDPNQSSLPAPRASNLSNSRYPRGDDDYYSNPYQHSSDVPNSSRARTGDDLSFIPPAGPASGMYMPNPSPYSYDRSPYYPPSGPSQPDYDQDYSRPESSRHRKVSLLIRDVMPLERQLAALVSKRLRNTDTLDHINRVRLEVREKLEQILLLDLEYSINSNLDQVLWKSVYHQILEHLRTELQGGAPDSPTEANAEIRGQINLILDEADANYHAFLTKLERQYQFDLSLYTSAHRCRQTGRSLKLALIMSQRMLICLGDVARYRTQNTQGPDAGDYGRSRKLYLQASSVAPKNGKPYNQLAIIALNARRRLDTVFYFMRSISASNAFLSAKESLRAIYSDITKKHNQIRQEVERNKCRARSRLTEGFRSLSESHKRIELWVSPIDGSSVTNHIDDQNDLDDPKKMPCNELYRRLMTTFLSCQGMIFSKVGMEHFPEASSQVLYELEALLSHSPLPKLDLTKLIQIFSISMFTIQHSAAVQLDPGSLEREKCRSYIQEQAVLLYLDMATVVIERCTALLNSQTKHTKPSLSHPDLLLIIPVVKLITDWMTCHSQLWNPPPCPRDPLLGPVLDPWLAMAQLANTLTQIDGVANVTFYTGDDVDTLMSSSSDYVDNHYTWLLFPEELELRGFLPLMNLANDDVFIEAHGNTDQTQAAMCYRVRKLITFADYLCGIEPAMLDFDTRIAKYKSLVEPPTLSEKTTPATGYSETNQSDDQFAEDSDVSDGSDASSEDEGVGGVSQLRKTKKRLSQQLARQQKQQRLHQAVLDNESHGVLRLEIRPIFVVPDTNCFIEYLPHMRALITSLKFTVVVPLVVINELDGLSRSADHRGNQRRVDSEHADTVRREAVKAVEFLESQFESRNNRLKALTISGTELHTITYRSEEDTSDSGTNDDRILSCCLHYCKDNARDFMPKDRESTITLYREVVLVTDDRNLRLKAHTRNVPVKDLIQFIEWAGIRG